MGYDVAVLDCAPACIKRPRALAEKGEVGEATDAFLKESGMTAPTGVGYCLAVRKG
jgi:hypothetical protein